MKSGIYKITSPDGKVYIGQAKNTKLRMRRYFTKQISEHPRLKDCALIHGIENFKFEVIYECLPEELNYWERHFQDLYNVCGPNGLNCKLTLTENKPAYLSLDAKKRLSESKKGHKNMLGWKKTNQQIKQSILASEGRMKSIICLETGEVFKSSRDCSARYGFKMKTIRQSILRNRTCGNLNFRYIKEESIIGSLITKLVFDKDTGVYFYSVNEACTSKTFNYSIPTLTKMLSGKQINTTSLIYA